MWDRASFLKKRIDNQMWRAPVSKYITDTKFPLWSDHHSYSRTKTFKFPVDQLAKKYNIDIAAFHKARGSNTASTIRPNRDNVKSGAFYKTVTQWEVPVGDEVFFVLNDTKIGAAERAKHHWRNHTWVDAAGQPAKAPYHATVIVLNPADKEKPANYELFLKHICTPPKARISKASELMEKPRKTGGGNGMAKNITIMKLCERNSGGYYRSQEMVWRDGGKADTYDATQTYYYVPLSGYNMEIEADYGTAKSLFKDIVDSGVMPSLDLYGVRKGDIEWVKLQKNWVNIEQHIKKVLGKVSGNTSDITMSFAKSELGSWPVLRYNALMADKVTNPNSPFLMHVNKFKDIPNSKYDKYHLDRLCNAFKVPVIDASSLVESLKQECEALYQRYSLFSSLRDSSYNAPNPADVAEYINLIDTSKGV
jgi:hypothetical protein